jgi:apolipoprotein D and lipocalin family protein
MSFLLNYRVFIFITLFFTALGIFVGCGGGHPLETVASVDPVRYAGRWYEIASFPMRAQKGCKCTYAEYTVLEPGVLSVYNRCINENSLEIKYISGTAYAEDGSNNTRFKVQFFPLIKAPYYILALDSKGYDWAMVGTPDRDYLWLLSRTTTMEKSILDSLLKKAEALGFEISRLQTTTHDCPAG